MDNFKKYLPSKKFLITIIIIVVAIILFFVIKKVIPLIKFKKNGANGEPITMTVGDLIQKDTNSNGIPDWEEYLWGLNPNITGPENKEFILAKKKSLEKNGVISEVDDGKIINQNQIISRQFFATIMSLQQSGELDEEAMNTISETIGKEIKPTPLNDIYTKDMLKIKNITEESKLNYSTSFDALVNKYTDTDMGKEMMIFSQGIASNDTQALYATSSIASSYRDFASELLLIPVPNSASIEHLSLANNYYKTGVSIDGILQVSSDPIVAMKSLMNYKKYSDAIVANYAKLANILE